MPTKWLDFLLSRRYGITVMGDPLPQAAECPPPRGALAGGSGPDAPALPEPVGVGPFLILPNHPALVDPLMIYAYFAPLRPRLLLTAPSAKVLHFFVPEADVILLPAARDKAGDEQSGDKQARALAGGALTPAAHETALAQAADCLAEGRSLIVWPAGHLQSRDHEKVEPDNTAATLFKLLQQRAQPLPELFLVRTEGLWGSRFSRYFTPEQSPGFFSTLCRQIPALLLGPLLPSRPVRMVLRRHRCKVSACNALGKETLTAILNSWYDAGTAGATLVPRLPLCPIRRMPLHKAPQLPAQGSPPCAQSGSLADPDPSPGAASAEALAQADSPTPSPVQEGLLPEAALPCPPSFGKHEPEKIEPPLPPLLKSTGAEVKAATDRILLPPLLPPPLAEPLGTAESPSPPTKDREEREGREGREGSENTESTESAERKAENKAEDALRAELSPAFSRTPPLLPIQHALTRQGSVMDVSAGQLFSRRSLLGLAKALGTLLGPVPAARVGMALPAGAGAMAAYIAILDSSMEDDRLPVLLNPDLSPAQLDYCVQATGITHVITSRRLQGRGLPPNTSPLYLEDISSAQIMRGCALSFMGFAGNTDVDAPAAIVFTAGSSGQPKALSLSHTNLMTSLRALLRCLMSEALNAQALSLLSCLPPHSPMGLLTNIILPLTCGVPTVTVSDSSDGPTLAHSAARYGVNLVVGTATILKTLLHAAPGPLPLRFALCGQEPCPPELHQLFAKVCPQGLLLESYSLAETSVLTLNTRPEAQPGTAHPVGKMLPGMDYALNKGKLYVRGENVFHGYLDGYDPRVSLPNLPEKDWFPTGDMFEADKQGFLYWKGKA